MKKSVYKDYTKASEYFSDSDEELLQKEINDVEKTKKYFIWVQEFSKKIIVVAFLIYVLSTLFCLALVFLSYYNGELVSLDTLISETNLTFREVIGGYLIKAALENVFKIGGNYFVGFADARLKALNIKKEGDNFSEIPDEKDFAG